MKYKIFVIAMSTFFIGASCGSKIQAPIPKDNATCSSACQHLQYLHCPEGDDLTSNNGVITCVEWCKYTINELRVDLRPSCVVKITSCEKLNTDCPSGLLRE